MENQKLRVLPILWSSVLILLLPLIINFVVVVGFGFVIGFQTRGDQAIIAEKQMALQVSIVYQLVTFLIVALVILWRVIALSKRVTNRVPLHAIIAVVLGVIVRFLLLMVMSSAEAVFRPMLAVELLIYAAATCVGLWLGTGRRKLEPQVG